MAWFYDFNFRSDFDTLGRSIEEDEAELEKVLEVSAAVNPAAEESQKRINATAFKFAPLTTHLILIQYLRRQEWRIPMFTTQALDESLDSIFKKFSVKTRLTN